VDLSNLDEDDVLSELGKVEDRLDLLTHHDVGGVPLTPYQPQHVTCTAAH
jgi:hypothetical protein